MQAMEIFTLVTGVIYLLLEIRQSNWMWAVGILTGAAAAFVFWQQSLYASMGLNIYYVAISFWGLYAWARDRRLLEEQQPQDGDSDIHLTRLTWQTCMLSALMVVAGTVALVAMLKWLGDPMSTLDAGVAVLSAVATWWLSRSIKEQWLIWVVADGFSTVLCATQGLWWMVALYLFYTLSSVYGYINWNRKGVYIS